MGITHCQWETLSPEEPPQRKHPIDFEVKLRAYILLSVLLDPGNNGICGGGGSDPLYD